MSASPEVDEAQAQAIHCLGAKTVASAQAVGNATGLARDEAAALLSDLAERGLAQQLSVGCRLTDEGTAALRSLRAADVDAADRDALERAYEDFEEPNERVLKVVTDWQTVVIGDERVPNDHEDAEYDASVLEELHRVHAEARPILQRMVQQVPRLQRYLDRLDAAVARVERGEHDYVARVDLDSYHTVWFELHEDVLQLLGRERRTT